VVAIPRQPESLVESVFGWRATRRKVRADRARAAGRPVPRGPGVLARLGLVLADVMGTLVMCAAITYGVFQLAVWAGFVVGGLLLPLVEFKVMYPAKKRREAERAAER
jgi:hypothetical protein